jgi:hypothetical protein
MVPYQDMRAFTTLPSATIINGAPIDNLTTKLAAQLSRCTRRRDGALFAFCLSQHGSWPMLSSAKRHGPTVLVSSFLQRRRYCCGALVHCADVPETGSRRNQVNPLDCGTFGFTDTGRLLVSRAEGWPRD